MISTPSRIVAAVVTTSLFLASAGAQDFDIAFTERTLDNGLRVIVHEDPKAPIVAVNIWYHVGSKNEPEGRSLLVRILHCLVSKFATLGTQVALQLGG